MPNPSLSQEPRGSRIEVLLVFLRLGCTSFGGPIAHLGYFQKEFVERRKWCSEAQLAELQANIAEVRAQEKQARSALARAAKPKAR